MGRCSLGAPSGRSSDSAHSRTSESQERDSYRADSYPVQYHAAGTERSNAGKDPEFCRHGVIWLSYYAPQNNYYISRKVARNYYNLKVNYNNYARIICAP